MSVDLEQFVWECPDAGYAWRDASDAERREKGRFLTEAAPGEGDRILQYAPLHQYPLLYKTFAQTEPVEERFRQFADKYGHLGIDVFLSDAGPLRSGEPFKLWVHHHRRIKAIADLLDAIQNRDATALRGWIEVRINDALYNRDDETERQFAVIAADRAGGLTLRAWLMLWAAEAKSTDGRVLRYAKGWAQKVINDALTGQGRNEPSLVTARVLLNHERNDLSLHIVPRTLLGAMWLQCARVLTVNPNFRQCNDCLEWFELSPDARRKNTKYCSARCRVAAYRKRSKISASKKQ